MGRGRVLEPLGDLSPQAVAAPEQGVKLDGRRRHVGDGAVLVDACHVHIVLGRQGQALLFQAAVDELPQQVIERRKQRHAQQHPPEAHEMVEQQQGEEHPKGRQARRVAQNFGADDVAVHLLQDDDEDQEDETFVGVGQQEQKRRGDGPKEGTEDGDDVGDAHDGADETGVGDAQNGQAGGTEQADDEGVQQLAGDEIGKDAVDDPQVLQDAVAGGALAAEGEEKFFTLAHEVVPAHEHIGHDDDPNDKVEHTDGGGSDPFHDVRQGRERVILEPGLEHPGHFVQRVLNDLGGLAVLHQKIGEIFGKALDHFRQTLDQRRKIHHHLGDDEIGEQKDQGQQDDGRKGGGEGAGRFGLHMMEEQKLLGKPRQGVEQVGHHAAQHDGPQRSDHAGQGMAYGAEIQHEPADQKDDHQTQQHQGAVEQDFLEGNFQLGEPPSSVVVHGAGRTGPERRDRR